MIEESKSSFDEALKLLTSGQVPINEKTGKPNIKDIMDTCKISRSYAYKVRRRYLREKKAREEGVALPSKIEITRKAPPKPPPPRRRPEEPPEAEIPPPSGVTPEDIEDELKWFEDSLKDFYEMLIGKDDSIIVIITNDKDYGRPSSKINRLAHRWVQWMRRRIDPETLEGWDTYFLIGDHIFGIIAPILMVWWRKHKEAEKKKEATE